MKKISPSNLKKSDASNIEKRIFIIRDQKVLLDSDLAQLYGVETKQLNQAVKRNLQRFPIDFMFQLSPSEFDYLRSQIVTSSVVHGGRRTLPYAFTEHGVAMLSSVLNSNRAIEVNIRILRTFIKFRELLATHHDLSIRIHKLESKQQSTSKVLEILADEIDSLDHEVKTLKMLP